jgi:translation initiation factor 6 (eIF-6)
MMTRDMIVPDCLGFYILSLFPMQESELNEQERSLHMGKIQWVVNQVMGNDVFSNDRVSLVNQYMKRNKGISVEQLLRNTDYSAIR